MKVKSYFLQSFDELIFNDSESLFSLLFMATHIYLFYFKMNWIRWIPRNFLSVCNQHFYDHKIISFESFVVKLFNCCLLKILINSKRFPRKSQFKYFFQRCWVGISHWEMGLHWYVQFLRVKIKSSSCLHVNLTIVCTQIKSKESTKPINFAVYPFLKITALTISHFKQTK